MKDQTELAEQFNEHFVSMGQKIADSFETNNNFRKYLPNQSASDFKFRPVSGEELEWLINTLKNKKKAQATTASPTC